MKNPPVETGSLRAQAEPILSRGAPAARAAVTRGPGIRRRAGPEQMLRAGPVQFRTANGW
ncbi:hypothetical protein PSCLAVI8L_120104 [Pseudoclavibacter sp. 8L]|nr:hypothetical protein PSCLAVI8L_120104 [Pseudoclavibacter sp. 8L]